MTPDDQKALAGDSRRAAALILHNSNGNVEGINAVLQEAAEVHRVTNLILSLLSFYDQLIPELRTDLGMQLLSQHVVRVAGQE